MSLQVLPIFSFNKLISLVSIVQFLPRLSTFILVKWALGLIMVSTSLPTRKIDQIDVILWQLLSLMPLYFLGPINKYPLLFLVRTIKWPKAHDTLSLWLKCVMKSILVSRHTESMEACVDRYVEFNSEAPKTLSVVEDYALVLYTHVSRSSCCFHVATLTPRTSLALCRHVSPLQNGLLL